MSSSRTYFAKQSDISKSWILVDAQNKVLGRLCSQISKVLRGKHKPTYTPHMDCGDNVVVINADHVKLTGKKYNDKVYYKHTGYPGGLKKIKVSDMFADKNSAGVIRLAVKRMMPKESPLARTQLKNLYIYGGEAHPHSGQKPVLVNLLR